MSRFVLPAGIDSWPEFRAAGLTQVGAFMAVAIWAHNANTGRVGKGTWRPYRSVGGCDVNRLVSAGLWIPAPDGAYDIPSMAMLRGTRGRRGAVFKLSRRLPDGVEAHRAGLPALGLWFLAASWSLTTDSPGYIPTAEALKLGKQKHIAALWDSKMWRVDEHGFHMAQGPLEWDPWWKLARDDERAPIPPQLRRAIYERDGWKCVKCGSTEHLALDHIYPWSKGGPDTAENLRVLCRTCNGAKGARIE